MKATAGMRVLSTVNVAIAFVNIVLISLIGYGYLSFKWSKATKTVSEDASIMGMEVFFVRPPYAVFVDNDFPRKKRFKFVEYDSQLFLSADDPVTEEDGSTRQVAVSLGTDFSLSFEYYPDKNNQVRDLMLTKTDESLVDLNADGLSDVRMTIDPKLANRRIWYQGEWQSVARDSVMTYDKHKATLPSGEIVVFDLKAGRWVPRLPL